jgi:hypothetical protein
MAHPGRALALGFVALAVFVLVAVAVGRAPDMAAARQAPAVLRGLARLPSAARGPIAAALARDAPGSFLQRGELTASHGVSGEEFGESVAISGNTIVVGTPNYVDPATNVEQGAAYVFTKPASGWAHVTQTARLTAARGQSEELFGACVSISGDTIVVGAPFRAVGGHAGQGVAYVFVKRAAGWRSATPAAELTAARGATDQFFAESVAVSGATIVAGVPGGTVGGHALQGAADVFTRPASGWSGSLTERAVLRAADGLPGDALGDSVAISGATIVAGADRHAVAGAADAGAAYVFVEPARGWTSATQTAELTAPAGAAGDHLGEAVAVSGATVLAGAPGRAVGGNAAQGAVYVFARPASGWGGPLSEAAELTAADGAKDDALGRPLAISGDVVVAGSRFTEVANSIDQGAAYVFARPAAGWVSATQTAELTAADGATGDSLGRAVAVSGGTVVVAAPDHRVGRKLAQGAVYVFISTPI